MKKTLMLLAAVFVVGMIYVGQPEPGRAQVQNASLTGLIIDPTGAVVRGASVTARNSATNVVYTQETDAAGYYLFASLPIGAYAVSVELPGFKKEVHNAIVLEVGQRARNDFTLEVGGVTEVVEVEAAASVLETQQAARARLCKTECCWKFP